MTQELEQKHSEQEKELAENYQLKLATALAHLKGIHSVIDTVVEASEHRIHSYNEAHCMYSAGHLCIS